MSRKIIAFIFLEPLDIWADTPYNLLIANYKVRRFKRNQEKEIKKFPFWAPILPRPPRKVKPRLIVLRWEWVITCPTNGIEPKAIARRTLVDALDTTPAAILARDANL